VNDRSPASVRFGGSGGTNDPGQGLPFWVSWVFWSTCVPESFLYGGSNRRLIFDNSDSLGYRRPYSFAGGSSKGRSALLCLAA
jgi:hypothetical protein